MNEKRHFDDRYCTTHGWVGAQYWQRDGQCAICVVEKQSPLEKWLRLAWLRILSCLPF